MKLNKKIFKRSLKLPALLCGGALILFQSELHAQANTQLPYIPEIAQSIIYRPSIFPKNIYYFGMPFISDVNINLTNDGLNYLEAHSKQNENAYINVPTLLDNLNANNTLALDYSLDLLSFGFRSNKNYFSFNLTERLPILFQYSDDLMNLLYKGNAAFLGQTIDYADCKLDASHFWEIGFGMTRQINKLWSAGVRIKRLYGIENISSKSSKLSAYTDATNYKLQLESDLVINASSPINNPDGYSSTSMQSYLTNTDNGGWAANFGVSFNMNEKWVFSFDALDIGKITWNTAPINSHLDNGIYSFSGVGLDEFLHSTSDTIDFLDSLENSFKPVKTYNSYSTSLASRYILCADHKLGKKTFATLALRGTYFQGEILPSATLLVRHKLGTHISLDLNFARQYDNIYSFGGGLVMQLQTLNFFILSDNLFGTIQPLSGKLTHLNFGLNFCWLKKGVKSPPKKDKTEDIERY